MVHVFDPEGPDLEQLRQAAAARAIPLLGPDWESEWFEPSQPVDHHFFIDCDTPPNNELTVDASYAEYYLDMGFLASAVDEGYAEGVLNKLVNLSGPFFRAFNNCDATDELGLMTSYTRLKVHRSIGDIELNKAPYKSLYLRLTLRA